MSRTLLSVEGPENGKEGEREEAKKIPKTNGMWVP